MNSPQIDLSLLHPPAKSRRRWLWVLLIALVALAAGVWFFFFRSAETPLSFVTAEIKRQDLVVTVQATGNLEPVHTVEVGIEVSGTLDEVLVDFNDPVKKGQVLARLDTAKLDSALRSSRAALRVAEANVRQQAVALNEARLQHDRLEAIFAETQGGYPSTKEMEAARAAFNRAEAAHAASLAQLEQAKASVATDEENLRKAVVLSPIDGIVLTREVDPGQTVAASMQAPKLFTLAEDLKKMQVIVAVDEADVGEVRAGQAVSFSVNAYPDRLFEGTVAQVRLGSQIVGGVVTYNAVVRVDNSQGLLRPGMTAQASIITKKTPNALAVPNAAFRFTPPQSSASAPAGGLMRVPGSMRTRSNAQNGDRIWLLKDGQPVMVKVKKGDTDGSFSALIEGDAAEGDRVITGAKQK
ncbi:MAG: efflux RND transporter periplasmic adaptor subunit [Campylobacterales bacterium]